MVRSSALVAIGTSCPQCQERITLTRDDVPTGQRLEDVRALVCQRCGIDVSVKNGRRTYRKGRARVLIRAFRYGSFWHWQWRCTHWTGVFNPKNCSGGSADVASYREAFEQCRVHAWLKHGVRL